VGEGGESGGGGASAIWSPGPLDPAASSSRSSSSVADGASGLDLDEGWVLALPLVVLAGGVLAGGHVVMIAPVQSDGQQIFACWSRDAEGLRRAILKRAFGGQLVPQDANDEPASVLLERIRKQREAEAQAKPRRSAPRRRLAPRKTRRA
jgi:type I restriction enzyme S subunit